jgi:hypothetical protein
MANRFLAASKATEVAWNFLRGPALVSILSLPMAGR